MRGRERERGIGIKLGKGREGRGKVYGNRRIGRRGRRGMARRKVDIRSRSNKHTLPSEAGGGGQDDEGDGGVDKT